MKRSLLFGLLLCLALPVFAQEPGDISVESSIRKWDDGPLSLKDFSYRTGGEFDNIARLAYGIRWADEKHKVGNTSFYYPEFFTYMNPYASWIKPDYRNEHYLRFVQTQFDYVELCKRRAQKDVYRQGNTNVDYTVKFHIDVAEGFFEKLEAETRNGMDTTAVKAYQERVAAELAMEENIVSALEFKINPKGYALGMHVGLGSEFHMGNMAQYMTPLVGLEFGFDFCFNRWTIYWDGLLGFGGSLKRDIPRSPQTWDAGADMKGGNINLSLAFTAWDSQWWKVAPLAGIGVDFIDYPKRASRSDNAEIAAFRALAGLNVDFKFARIIQNKMLGESTVRARLYGAFNNYPEPMGQAWSINFGIGVNWLAWVLK